VNPAGVACAEFFVGKQQGGDDQGTGLDARYRDTTTHTRRQEARRTDRICTWLLMDTSPEVLSIRKLFVLSDIPTESRAVVNISIAKDWRFLPHDSFLVSVGESKLSG
jgi:hypothetical protein